MEMSIRTRTFAFAAVAPLMLSACATKGWVRKELTAQRTITDSSLAMERTARISGDSATIAQFNAQLASLRQDLDSMRTQFNARIAVVEKGLQFALPVTFAFDDASVNQADHESLQRFAQIAAKYYPGSAITIEGFADPAGSQAYNLDLSRRRAENVRGYLTSFGLTDTHLRTVGYGEARQVVAGAAKDEPGAERNRRVVFVIESKGGDPMVALATPDE
jgi:outer membrane protein OmpA-like peptidoglycan-associated protein